MAEECWSSGSQVQAGWLKHDLHQRVTEMRLWGTGRPGKEQNDPHDNRTDSHRFQGKDPIKFCLNPL